MTKWWRDEWSDLTATFSIHDFVKSTNMIEETIKRNIEKASAEGKSFRKKPLSNYFHRLL